MDSKHILDCRTNYIGRQYLWLEDTDSTNEVIKRLLLEDVTIESIGGDLHGLLEGVPENGFVIVADHQTKGKGRSGRVWEDKKGNNIAMSILLKPEVAVDNTSIVTLVSALAVARAIRMMSGLDVSIKWPNDVIIEDRKVCGILTELVIRQGVPYVIVGIGVNVNQANVSPQIADRAISMYQASGSGVIYDREELVESICTELERYYHIYEQTGDMTGLKDEYEGLLINTDRRVSVLDPGESMEGVAKGIDTLGRLIVESDDGKLHHIYAGEVSVRGVYGYV